VTGERIILAHRWNDTDGRNPKYFEKRTLSKYSFSTTNPTWTGLG